MAKFLLVLSLMFLSSCMSYMAVENNKDDNDENDISIVEAIKADGKVVGEMVDIISDEINSRKESSSPLMHEGKLDSDCKEEVELKVCSVSLGCWCETN